MKITQSSASLSTELSNFTQPQLLNWLQMEAALTDDELLLALTIVREKRDRISEECDRKTKEYDWLIHEIQCRLRLKDR